MNKDKTELWVTLSFSKHRYQRLVRFMVRERKQLDDFMDFYAKAHQPVRMRLALRVRQLARLSHVRQPDMLQEALIFAQGLAEQLSITGEPPDCHMSLVSCIPYEQVVDSAIHGFKPKPTPVVIRATDAIATDSLSLRLASAKLRLDWSEHTRSAFIGIDHTDYCFNIGAAATALDFWRRLTGIALAKDKDAHAKAKAWLLAQAVQHKVI